MKIDSKKTKELFLLCIPYMIFSYVGNKICYAYRIAEGNEKAFASIAEMKYNFKSEPKTEESPIIAEEQEIFDNLKAENPDKPTVADLSVGDIIFYDGNRREVEKIDENSIMLKDLDAPDYGGVLLGTSDIFSYKGWQDEMNAKGFEIISKAETVEQEKDLGPITMRKVGDFYEMYGKNAQIAADILDLHLTAKNGEDMVGFPDSVKDDYADKLRENGYSVLIEESFDINPPKREENLMNDIFELDKNTPENSEIEEDAPLFIDNDVIEEIEKSENASDNRPFHEIPDIQGEQLTLFGDSVPIGEKNKPKQNKEKFAEGLFLGGVNRFTALHDEIMRGTGFQDGKFRVKQFYDEKKPTNKEFADFLKNEYGIGGHSGDDVISFVDHDSKGMYFTLRSDEKFQFTWSDVAEMTSGIIDKGEYITQNDIDSRIRNARFELNEGINADYYDETTEIRRENARKILSEYGYTENINDVSESIISTEPEITIDTVQIGDKFRNRETGEISEIVGLTGALPWYTEDCTVKRESEGFVITQNIPYSKILDSNLYDYIGKNEIAIEEVESKAPEKAENFTITDDNLGNGGAKTKFKNNISAIETLKALENEKRSATIEEKNVLVQYVGWGGIPQAFDKNNSSWEKEYAQLKDLLTESEYSSARASVLDAFFTSPTIVDGIYEALANFGFEGGNVLEPAMGIGNFFGCMPEEMRADSRLYGMEIDSISGRIAKQLYPDADIAIKGFEHNNFQDGSFDVAIGNVPFGELSFKDNKHTRELLDAQELNKSDDIIKGLQVKLNAVYDDFYKKYGLIHSQTNKRYFSDDVSYNLVAGLEKKYNKTKLIEKSDIFFKRTIQPPKAVEHVETGIEALTLSIAERAGVDFEYMSNLTGMTEDELKHDLQGEIYKIPHSENAYQTASEYLSGDIREKLRIAEEIAEYDADFIVNVNALKAAMPTPLKAGDIDVKLGATWIDPKYYEQFMYETFQTPREHRNDVHHPVWQRPKLITAEYSEHSGSWHIGNKSYDKSVIAMQQYGTRKMGAYEIMEHLLNLKEPKIYKTIEVPDGMGDVKEKRVVDIDATRVVQKKADKIRDEFKKWIFKDSTRREEIVDKYNDLFNSTRPREYDGSALKFPMMNSDIKLHEHQKNAIAHAMFGGNTLFAHCVGAGKTFEMIATAMESKRLGLCTKSLFAVPNHLTEQIGDDFQKLYPSANILVATKKDFQKENRQQLFAKIATGNFDAVIIGHSQLGMIPISKERQEMELQSQIDDILLGIEELNKSEGSRFQIKAMERTKKSLDKQLDKLQKNHDDTITFEQLGVDKLFVDEAHEFKNLFCPTKLNNISGISNSASQKALDLYLKCRYLDEKTDGKGVVFATGTPLSNSVTELHTMMRYLEYDYLKSKGLQHFDNWVTVVSQQKGRQIQLFILTLFCGNRRFLLSASLLLINL